MPIRLSGMMSGLDTDSMVKELMKAQRMKSSRIEKSISRIEWTQEKWKGLNTKLYSFYTGPLSKLRMQGSFNAKTATSSNESKLEVKANSSAAEGVHKIKVDEVASAQFITGDKLNGQVNFTTKLSSLITTPGGEIPEGTVVKIDAGEKVINFNVNKDTTIGDFVDACKEAGLNANFDTVQNRFFISSKESGVKNAFSITMSSSQQVTAETEIRNFIGYSFLSDSKKDEVNNALAMYLTPGKEAEAKDTLLNMAHDKVKADFIKEYTTNQTNIDRVADELQDKLNADGEVMDPEAFLAEVNKLLNEEALNKVNEQYAAWETNTPEAGNIFQAAQNDLEGKLTTYALEADKPKYNALSLLGLNEFKTDSSGAITTVGSKNMVFIQSSDAKINYNGIEINSSSNTISVNGLTLTVKGKTVAGEELSLNITKNTQAVYDTVKDFIKSYNTLLMELNENYNATSARGFEPLTSDEREAMTDKQIELWEDRIKNSLLRRDSKIGSIMDGMRNSVSRSVRVDNKAYSLASFGIVTGDYTEKGILHIQGDLDSPAHAGLENKLMKAISEDPDNVMKVMNELSNDLYKKMSDQMSSTSISSALTFYNDKEMKSTLDRYKKDLSRMEQKLATMEERYHRQFTAMEKAMSQLNNQSSSLAAMMGMNNQK